MWRAKSDKTLKNLKKYERMFPWGSSWKTSLVNNTAYQFVGSHLGAKIFLKMRKHQKKNALKQNIKASLYTLHWGFNKIPFTLYIYVLAKVSLNDAKVIQKLTPGLKNHMRNLDNFRQAMESPKSWNSMGYFSPKSTFLQLKHYIQGI